MSAQRVLPRGLPDGLKRLTELAFDLRWNAGDSADEFEIAIPGRHAGFATIETAQAVGDFEVLASRHRRVMRVHVGDDSPSTLFALEQLGPEILSD
jgi:hypothetical protein